jgi:dTDP-L-rhamnose 4-epimerase
MPLKKILVTGGAGFIGSFIVDSLITRGYEVTIFDNLEPQVHDGAIPKYINPHARFVSGDIRDYEALKGAMKSAEAIFHQAAMVGVGQSMFQVRKYVEINSVGTANVLDILANEPHSVQKLIVASSMSIYGEGLYKTKDGRIVEAEERSEADLASKRWECYDPKTREPLTPCPTPETKEPRSSSIYAITKKNQEEQVMVFGKAHQLPVVGLRYFNTYGPRQSLKNPYTGVAAIFINRLKCGEPMIIFEDGEQQRDFVSVHDIAQANILALEKKEADHEVFNVGSGQPISINALADIIMEQYLGGRASSRAVPKDVVNKYRKGDIRHCYADITKIRKRLGFEPKVSMADGMRELIQASEKEACENKADFKIDYLAKRKLVV